VPGYPGEVADFPTSERGGHEQVQDAQQSKRAKKQPSVIFTTAHVPWRPRLIEIRAQRQHRGDRTRDGSKQRREAPLIWPSSCRAPPPLRRSRALAVWPSPAAPQHAECEDATGRAPGKPPSRGKHPLLQNLATACEPLLDRVLGEIERGRTCSTERCSR